MMESKKLRTIALITIAVILLIIATTLLIANNQKNKVNPKPEVKNSETKEGEWYVVFSVKDQKVTAYVDEATVSLSSSGRNYFTGAVAVHPIYSGADPRKPIIPFGTTLYLDKPIMVQGQERTSFEVIDTGDVYYRLWSEYPYWFDVYFGTGNYYNRKDARDFGTDLVSYYWVEKWR